MIIIIKKQVSIILVRLPIDYESVRVVALATSVSLELLARMLTDYESRQLEFVANFPIQANVVQQQKCDEVD